MVDNIKNAPICVMEEYYIYSKRKLKRYLKFFFGGHSSWGFLKSYTFGLEILFILEIYDKINVV